MKRAGIILAALITAVVFGMGGAAAQADHYSHGFGGSYRSNNSYSNPSYGYGQNHSHNQGYGSYGNYGGRSSTHYDYHPTQVQFHRGHVHVNPGHYDLHRSGRGHW